jgi:hypothetical protein
MVLEEDEEDIRTAGGPNSGRYKKGSGQNPQAGKLWASSLAKKDGAKFTIEGQVSDETIQEVFDDPAMTSAHLEKVALGMIGSIPGEVHVKWREGTIGDDTVIEITATRQDGLNLKRTFSRQPDGSLMVYHNSFHVPKKDSKGALLQGTGLAKNVLADSFETYQQLGVDKIQTYANKDVGGYAWAKFGFKASDPRELEKQLVKKIRSLPIAHRTEAMVILAEHRNDPKLPWYIAGIHAGDVPVGKNLLLGTEWAGTLDMSDQESVDRFKHYVKDKP